MSLHLTLLRKKLRIASFHNSDFYFLQWVCHVLACYCALAKALWLLLLHCCTLVRVVSRCKWLVIALSHINHSSRCIMIYKCFSDVYAWYALHRNISKPYAASIATMLSLSRVSCGLGPMCCMCKAICALFPAVACVQYLNVHWGCLRRHSDSHTTAASLS